jgi:hypothetical protein
VCGLRIRRLDCTSKKVEVGIHTSTSRLASLCMGLVFEKAVTLRETVREVDSTTNKITPCQRFGNSMKAEESLAYRSSCEYQPVSYICSPIVVQKRDIMYVYYIVSGISKKKG